MIKKAVVEIHKADFDTSTMPSIPIPGPYEFGFFSNEGSEPAHVHASREGKKCKFWLGPVRLADGGRFAGHELNKIRKLPVKHEHEIQAKWDEHFPG